MGNQFNPYFMGNMGGFYSDEWVLVWTPAGYMWERRFHRGPFVMGHGILMSNGTVAYH